MLTFSLAVMAILGPAALIAGAFERRGAGSTRTVGGEAGAVELLQSMSLCIGCDKCVHTCPQRCWNFRNPHKRVMRVARETTVQCRACDGSVRWALKMYRSDGPARPSGSGSGRVLSSRWGGRGFYSRRRTNRSAAHQKRHQPGQTRRFGHVVSNRPKAAAP